jgi:uncharacterized protein
MSDDPKKPGAAVESGAEKENQRAVLAHVLPFAAWLALMAILGEPAGWKYALRSVAGLAAFLALRPWRWYAPLRLRHVVPALAVGVAVFVVWVGPETRWFGCRWLWLQEFYVRYGIGLQKFGELPDPLIATPYAPGDCGWPLAIGRLLGSAAVIAPIEEFFWRGFLYRMLVGRRFLKVDAGKLHVGMLLLMSLLFGLEHDRWFAGILAGFGYGLLYIRTRDIWAAALAHGVTNALLGVYVLKASAYQLW